jgi:uncharacterized protein
MPIPAFLVDNTVARLGRWMRLLGYDVVISKQSARELADKKEPETTGRILLGRCPGRSGAPAPAPHEGFVHIESEQLREQIRQVAETWPMPFRETFLTRCEDCNQKLKPPHRWAELPDDIASKVPPRVRGWLDDCRYCAACRKPYWEGTHVERMRHYLEDIIGVF